MCKFMYNISTVSSVSVEVVNKIKFEFSKKKKKKKPSCLLSPAIVYEDFYSVVNYVKMTNCTAKRETTSDGE